MKKRRITTISLLLVLMLLVSGCSGAKSPKQIAEKMTTELEKTPCTKMTMDMETKMTMSAENGTSMDIGMDISNETTLNYDPIATYSIMNMSMTTLGQTVDMKTETYTIANEDNIVSYTGMDGTWYKVAVESSIEELTAQASEINLDTETIALDKEVTEWEGNKVLCLKDTITGDKMLDLIGTTLQGMTDSSSAEVMQDIDWSQISCDLIIYVNPETYLPIAEEINISGMEKAMETIFSSLNVDVNIDTYKATIKYTSFDEQEKIEVPADVIEKASDL